MKKTVALTFIVAFAAIGCNNGDSPTAPDMSTGPTGPHTVLAGGASEPETVAAPAAPQQGVHVTKNPDGSFDVFNGTDQTYYGGVAVFVWSEHPQIPVGNQIVELKAGHKGTFGLNNGLTPNLDEQCGEIELQVDYVDGTDIPFADSSAIARRTREYVIVPVSLEECACQPGEWVETKRSEKSYGEWGECDRNSKQTEGCEEDKCYECREWTQEITETNGCEERTLVIDGFERQETECPCEEEWIELEPVIENVGDWSECQEGHNDLVDPQYTECEGVMSRQYDLVVYETNSCTQQTREKKRTTKTETSPCGYKCLAEITHTENKMYCGWLGCKHSWYIGSSVKWQCQSVPPGVPGHYPNHFDKNGHDDYFGVPDEEHCYNVTN